VFERDREALIMRKPWPNRGCCAIGKIKYEALKKLNSPGQLGILPTETACVTQAKVANTWQNRS
jgi:hypothetical protein